MKHCIKNCAITLFAVFLTLSLCKCNTNTKETPTVENLTLKKVIPINVPEPSGLAFSYDKKYFWTVGDSDSKIYMLNLNGKIINSFVINGEDLEGVSVIDSIHLAVILERTREVVIVDTSGNEIKRRKFEIEGKLNEGLEGICFDVSTKDFYLVNEKRPGLLIRTDSSFNEIFRKKIDFAKDYSDIFFSNDDNTLWILSDESKKIIQTNLYGDRIREYRINVKQPEGLVVDYANKKVFMVSDKKEELYEFNFP